jgi:hypothetical protein
MTARRAPRDRWARARRFVAAVAALSAFAAALDSCQVFVPEVNCDEFCNDYFLKSCSINLFGKDSVACQGLCGAVSDATALQCFSDKKRCVFGDVFGTCKADFCSAYQNVCGGGGCKSGQTFSDYECRTAWLGFAAEFSSIGGCPSAVKNACDHAIQAVCTLNGIAGAKCK